MVRVLPRDYYIGAVFFTIIVIFVVSIINGLIAGDAGDASTAVPNLMSQSEVTNFNRTLNLQTNLSSDASELKANLERLKISSIQSIVSLPLALIESAWSLITLITHGFGFFDGILYGIAAMLGIPKWIIGMVILIIIFFFVFSILSLIFGKEV